MSEHYLAVFGAIYRFAVGHCVVGSVEVGETSSMYHTPPPPPVILTLHVHVMMC